MIRTYRVTIVLEVSHHDEFDEDLREAVKETLRDALDQDDGGEEELEFEAEEVEDF